MLMRDGGEQRLIGVSSTGVEEHEASLVGSHQGRDATDHFLAGKGAPGRVR